MAIPEIYQFYLHFPLLLLIHIFLMFVISLVVFASHVSNLLYLSFYYCHLLRLCVFSFTCASSTRTYLIYKHY